MFRIINDVLSDSVIFIIIPDYMIMKTWLPHRFTLRLS